MVGDTYTFLAASKVVEHAPNQWAGKVVLVLLNDRNNVMNILVFETNGTSLAWPESLNDEVDHLATIFATQISEAR